MIIIPTLAGVARYSQRTILDGREYVLSFAWNSRVGKWSLSVADAKGVPIVQGIRIVCGLPLLRLLTDQRSPPGDLIALDRTGEGDPGFNDLGTRVVLQYIEASSLDTAV
jgi:hypothetical protein